MIPCSHFSQHQLAKCAFGKKSSKPRRDRAVQADLVATSGQSIAGADVRHRIIPAKAECRPCHIAEISFGHCKSDSAVGIARERSHLDWPELRIKQVNAEDRGNFRHLTLLPFILTEIDEKLVEGRPNRLVEVDAARAFDLLTNRVGLGAWYQHRHQIEGVADLGEEGQAIAAPAAANQIAFELRDARAIATKPLGQTTLTHRAPITPVAKLVTQDGE
ncbi:hypothetical protein M527_13700 [Sphingobium indicum IP26]|nr:hypothetical protein M527_13700 [Sphingobium indicum IP26]